MRAVEKMTDNGRREWNGSKALLILLTVLLVPVAFDAFYKWPREGWNALVAPSFLCSFLLQQIGFVVQKAQISRHAAKLADLQKTVRLEVGRVKSIIDAGVFLGLGFSSYLGWGGSATRDVWQAITAVLSIICIAVAAIHLYNCFLRRRFFLEISPLGLAVSWLSPGLLPWAEIKNCRLQQLGISRMIVLDLRQAWPIRVAWWRRLVSPTATATTQQVKIIGQAVGADTLVLYEAMKDRAEILGTF